MTRAALNEGARLLAEAGSVDSTAAQANVEPRTISSWRAGRIPSDRKQQKLLETFGIPLTAWRQVAGAPAVAKAAAKALSVPANDGQPASGAEPATGQPGRSNRDENAIERLREQCARLREQREIPGLTSRAIVELENLELRATAALARLTTHAVTEAQILASQPWQELLARITDRFGELDPLAISILWSACEPDSPEPAAALEGMRAAHPKEILDCEAANAALRASLLAALQKRQSDHVSLIPALGGQRQQAANS